MALVAAVLGAEAGGEAQAASAGGRASVRLPVVADGLAIAEETRIVVVEATL